MTPLFYLSILFFSRDQRLHKLVFGEDGLPDGTEVAYYARGKVVLCEYFMYKLLCVLFC